MIKSPPTNDPSLPSFLHPSYLEAMSDLNLVWDVWTDLKYCKPSYLPKEQFEPQSAYRNRLSRSHFDNRFSPAIKGHAGLLSEYTFTDDTAQSIIDNEKNIDMQGNDLATFFAKADELALRDEGCGILVEYQTEDAGIVSNGDLIKSGRRPYLVLIDRRDILNWSIYYVNGEPVINRLTIRETRQIDDGDFGSVEKTYYRVLRPGSFEVYEIVETNQKYSKALIEDMSGVTSLDRVPFVWYSISDSQLLSGKPPFINLARLNIEHVQKRSELNEILHKVNCPVPVRKGVAPIQGEAGQPPMMPPLIIGSNSFIDVPATGDFKFEEPTGSAVASTQADIEKLERSMDRVTLAFLGGSETAKTATEVMLDTAQTQASLKGLAIRKESCSQQVFGLWVSYTGEKSGGSLDINESVLQVPATAQDIQLILDAMGVQISRELGLKMLLEKRWLPADTDIDAELIATEQEKPDANAGVDELTNADAIASESARMGQQLETTQTAPAPAKLAPVKS